LTGALPVRTVGRSGRQIAQPARPTHANALLAVTGRTRMSLAPGTAESSRTPDGPPPTQQFPCQQCGAKLVFKPGIAALKCEHCGVENAIPQSEDEIRELDFHAHLARAAEAAESRETAAVKCGACGAEIEREKHATAFACPFCGTDVVAATTSRKRIKPKSLLPFQVKREAARAAFRQWVRRRWFAPNALRRYARLESRLNGIYVPYWTYDCQTTSYYRGQRGDDYYTTETYTTTRGGKTVTRTRRVRRTRWTPVNGVVWNTHDDVLVVASDSLPTKYVARLEPWDLESLVPYGDEYLSGFRAESYQLNLAQGFEAARGIMDDTIHVSVRRDIGGDHQRVQSVRTQYDDITFKHILLPIWISAYRFQGKTYRFLVNGRSGEVQGERPWSWIKITLCGLLVAAVLAAGIYLCVHYAG
jgi:predicted RNA-binding Zn-ribbon protein involved in translation (DUF1610 family)